MRLPLRPPRPAGRALPSDEVGAPGAPDGGRGRGRASSPPRAAPGEVPASFRVLRVALLGLLLMGALLSSAVALDEWATRGRVYPGVYVMDVSVGGMGPLEAMERVSAQTGGGSLAVYRFTASAGAAGKGREGARSFEYRSGDLGVDFDVRESARRAYLVGRHGGPLTRLKERLAARLSGRFPVEADMSYDRNLSRGAVEEISKGVERSSADARVEIEGARASLVPHVQGLRVDRERTLGSLSLALTTLTSEVAVSLSRPLPEVLTSGAEDAYERAVRTLQRPLRLEASFPKALGGEALREVAPEEVGEALVVDKVAPARDGGEASRPRLELRADAGALEPYAADFLSRLALDPEDARFDVSVGREGAEAVEVVAARPGSRPKETALDLAGRVADGLARRGEHRYEVKTEEVPASVSSKELEKLKPTGLLADRSVAYDATNGAAGSYDDPARLDNLLLAAGALDRQLVAPGESVSLLSLTEGLALAPATPAAGPEEPAAGDPERPAVDDGDGLSQAATALYGATLLSGLPVDERAQSPTAPLPYADGGLEAFVSPGTPGGADLVVRNDREEYLLVRAGANREAGTFEVGFYGRPKEGEPVGAARGELRSVRVGLEEGGADGLARETWRAERLGGAGGGRSLSAEDLDLLGEHDYAYPAAVEPPPPPPPPEPVDDPEDPEEDPAGSPPSLGETTPEGTTPEKEEPGPPAGESTGPLAGEGLVGPPEETAPEDDPEETASEEEPEPPSAGGIIGDDAGGFP